MRCPRCQTEVPAAAKFCMECGAALDRSPRSYTPNHLAERILTSRAALEGERKLVTVLFADVKGSQDLAESIDPEAWHRILDGFFAILADGVHRFEGTINQFTGDGIMALFGAPIAHEDHAQRACHAALHLKRDLAAYAAELRRTQGLNFSVRVGLNSGQVVVGKIGDDLRMDYTAQGHTVGLAARMERLAEPGAVYLTEHTAKLVSPYFRLKDLGSFQIQGARNPLHVFELEEVSSIRTRFDVSRARGLSRFVGRERELALLEQALARAVDGQGSIIGLVANPGVGKSRLCHEFAERCRARSLEVNCGQGVPHGKSTPFLPVLELMRDYFGIGERDPSHRVREKIAGKVLLLDPEAGEGLPLLFDYLGVPDPQRPPPRMDPEARERRFLDMIEQMVKSRSRGAPAVFVLEDLHWLEVASEAALARLAACVEGTHTLVVLNYRPEYRAPWKGEDKFREVRLRPLGVEAARELLHDLLGKDPSLAKLAQRILDRTQGNPFFLEEIVRSLVTSGVLSGDRGAHRLATTVEEITLPETVHAVVAARIDRLAERDKEVAAAASVIGKEVPLAVLERVTELPAADLESRVGHLIERDILLPRDGDSERSYAFRHPLTQEVAYATQLGERRAELHARVARATIDLYPDRQDELAAVIAQHGEKSDAEESLLEAIHWHQRAAHWIGMRNLAEAHRHWQRMRELLGEVPETEQTLWLGLAARAQILNVGWRAGISAEEAAEVFAEGRAIAEKTGEPRMLALLLSAYCAVRGFAGDVTESLELALEAARVAEQIDDLESRLVPRISLVYSYFTVGRLREALAEANELLSQIPDGDLRLGSAILGESPYLFLIWFRGMLYACLGRFADAEMDFESAIRIGREHGELEVVCSTHVSAALTARRIGDPIRATEHARRALELAEQTGSSLRRVYSSWAAGHAALARGDAGDAVECLERTNRLASDKRTGLSEKAIFVADLATAYVAAGRVAEARATASSAIEVALRQGTHYFEGIARLSLACALVAAKTPAERELAKPELEKALAIFREVGALPYEAQVREQEAELHARNGNEAAHRAAIEEARRLYLEMGADGMAERLLTPAVA